MSANIFTLSKREQRAAIAIVLALLLGTVVTHYRTLRADVRPPAPASATTPPEDQADTDDSR